MIYHMNENDSYSIRYVSRLTGLKPHILRSWESRYSAVCPKRSETNRRLYTHSNIRRLQLLCTAVQAGHSISQVALLDNDELIRLNNNTDSFRTKALSLQSVDSGEDFTAKIISDALDQIFKLDQVGVEKVLERAAVELPRSKFLHTVIQPLFEKVGELWANGELKIINERLATLATRSLLLDMLRTVVLTETAPRLVVAAPAGQWHETGALVVALTAAEFGWRPLYFGPNLPEEEIAAAVQKTKSKAVALSIGHRIDSALVLRELRKLYGFCGNQAKIFVGGYGIFDLMQHLRLIGVSCIVNIREFRSELELV